MRHDGAIKVSLLLSQYMQEVGRIEGINGCEGFGAENTIDGDRLATSYQARSAQACQRARLPILTAMSNSLVATCWSLIEPY
jgi:hypothetical protein